MTIYLGYNAKNEALAIRLFEWLLRFLFKENGFKFTSKNNPDPTVQCDTKLTQSQAQSENDQFLK